MKEDQASELIEETTDKQFSKSLTTVTPFSKYLAMILFIALPFLSGFLGYKYSPEKIVEVEKIVYLEKEIQPEDSTSLSKEDRGSALVKTECKEYSNEKYGFKFCLASTTNIEELNSESTYSETTTFNVYMKEITYPIISITPEISAIQLSDILGLKNQNISLTSSYFNESNNNHLLNQNEFIGNINYGTKEGVHIRHKEFGETDYYLFKNNDGTFFVYSLAPVVSTTDNYQSKKLIEPQEVQNVFIESFSFLEQSKSDKYYENDAFSFYYPSRVEYIEEIDNGVRLSITKPTDEETAFPFLYITRCDFGDTSCSLKNLFDTTLSKDIKTIQIGNRGQYEATSFMPYITMAGAEHIRVCMPDSDFCVLIRDDGMNFRQESLLETILSSFSFDN